MADYSDNTKEIVYQFQVVKPSSGRVTMDTGYGSSVEDAMAQVRGRYPSDRQITLVSDTPLGQRVETRTATEGSRSTTYDTVPLSEPAGRRDVDLRSEEDIAQEQQTAQEFQAAGGLGVAQKDEQTGEITSRNGYVAGVSTGSPTGTQSLSGGQTAQPMVSSYNGPSIVDYLDSVGQASDFGTRATLAQQYGIQNYTGTAAQNTQLLNTLRTQNPQVPVPQTGAPMGASAPQTGNYVGGQQASPVSIEDAFADFGIDIGGQLENFMKNPVASFEDTYDKLYKNLGIADLKKEASKLLAQATKYDEEFADKVADINDDPWLTEGVRVSRIRKEEERRDLKKAGVLNTLALYDKTIDSATDQARFLVQGLYDQYNADRNFTRDMIGFIYDRVDKANQAQADIASEARRQFESDREYDLDLARQKLAEYEATRPAGGSGVVGGGQIIGLNGQPIELGDGQATTISGFNTTIDSANRALELLASGVKTGPITGRLLEGRKLRDTADPNQLQLEQLLAKIKADFMKSISGAAVSDAEIIRLSKFLPSITDQEGVIQSKLSTLISETNFAKSNLLQTLGGTEVGTATQSGVTSSGLGYTIIQ